MHYKFTIMNANMQGLSQNIVTMSLSSKRQEQIKQNVQIFNLFHSKRKGNMFVIRRRNKSRQNGKTRQNGTCNNRLVLILATIKILLDVSLSLT